jgi:hypothetical protein
MVSLNSYGYTYGVFRRLHLNKGKNGIFMVITHEQGVLTSLLSLVSLELILVKFP